LRETATQEALLPQRPTTLSDGLPVQVRRSGSPAGCRMIAGAGIAVHNKTNAPANNKRLGLHLL